MPWKPLNSLLPQAASGGWIVGGISGSKAIREGAIAVVRMRDGAMEQKDGFGDERNDGLYKCPGCGA